MLNDQENARLADLLAKTDKTSDENVELAGLKARAIAEANAKDEVVQTAPAPLPTQSPPGSMGEAQAQIAELQRQFRETQAMLRSQQKMIQDQAGIIQGFKDAQDAIASGKVKVLFSHCNTCGRRLRKGVDGCPAHPNHEVNEVGLNPANGVMMLVSQKRGSGKHPAPKFED